jgi:hypothetical protein
MRNTCALAYGHDAGIPSPAGTRSPLRVASVSTQSLAAPPISAAGRPEQARVDAAWRRSLLEGAAALRQLLAPAALLRVVWNERRPARCRSVLEF